MKDAHRSRGESSCDQEGNSESETVREGEGGPRQAPAAVIARVSPAARVGGRCTASERSEQNAQ